MSFTIHYSLWYHLLTHSSRYVRLTYACQALAAELVVTFTVQLIMTFTVLWAIILPCFVTPWILNMLYKCKCQEVYHQLSTIITAWLAWPKSPVTKRVATHTRQKLISVCWCSLSFYWSVIGVSMALGLLAFRAIISLNAASPQELSQLCQQGFSDALCYLKRNSGWHQHLHDSLWCCLCMWRHWISPFGCWHGAGFYLSLALCSRSRLSTVCSYQPHPYSGEQLRVEVGGVCFGGFIARASSDVSGVTQASAMALFF